MMHLIFYVVSCFKDEKKFCSFNVPKYPFLFLQKNVYGASVIIFEGIMSFADKELLHVRPF